MKKNTPMQRIIAGVLAGLMIFSVLVVAIIYIAQA